MVILQAFYSGKMKINRTNALLRAKLKNTIRCFFTDAGFLEVDTPILTPHLIPEAHIDNFVTHYQDANGRSLPLYLEPSPEVWMKQLIAQGWGNIFQITPSFRNRESISPVHNPEFTMLEWYQMDADYMDSIETCEQLFQSFEAALQQALPPALAPPFRRMSMAEAFHSLGGMDLPQEDPEEHLKELCHVKKHYFGPEETAESLFNRLFLSYVEPELPADRPLILTDYPSWIPTLAKAQGQKAERWEMYAQGIELANCYTEEDDYQRVRQFWQSEGKAVAQTKAEPAATATDAQYPEIFKAPFPPCSGVALGLDRLLMLLCQEKDLEGVIFFPFSAILRGHNG